MGLMVKLLRLALGFQLVLWLGLGIRRDKNTRRGSGVAGLRSSAALSTDRRFVADRLRTVSDATAAAPAVAGRQSALLAEQTRALLR